MSEDDDGIRFKLLVAIMVDAKDAPLRQDLERYFYIFFQGIHLMWWLWAMRESEKRVAATPS